MRESTGVGCMWGRLTTPTERDQAGKVGAGAAARPIFGLNAPGAVAGARRVGGLCIGALLLLLLPTGLGFCAEQG
eukprot:scaffold7805_cov116-Isochrysis_galbana.AAC.17